MWPSTKIACGHCLAAVRSGMAECTPNFRASYEAADTTPRSSRCPPTTTALPFSAGLKSSSTDTKKASISTWKMVREADIHFRRYTTATRPKGETFPVFLHPMGTALAAGLGAICGLTVYHVCPGCTGLSGVLNGSFEVCLDFSPGFSRGADRSRAGRPLHGSASTDRRSHRAPERGRPDGAILS